MLQITANARRLRLRENLGLIVVDYIQLVDSDESRDSRQEQIAKISRRLKTLAREIEVPVIALSQLNRAVENREDRRPRMADLRESGAIEQDADLVLLLHRPEYYDPNDQPGIAELHHRQEPQRRHRHGQAHLPEEHHPVREPRRSWPSRSTTGRTEVEHSEGLELQCPEVQRRDNRQAGVFLFLQPGEVRLVAGLQDLEPRRVVDRAGNTGHHVRVANDVQDAAPDVDHQRGPLIDSKADQLGMNGQDGEEPAEAVALQEVLVDDRAGEKIEPLANVGRRPPPSDHHTGHDRGPGGRAADHSAAIEQRLELALDLGTEISLGK